MGRMSWADILFLYRARLRARAVLVQELFAAAGIAVGVALLFASQVASTSLGHSVSSLSGEIVGKGAAFQIQARGAGGMPEGLLQQASRLRGVTQTLAVLEVQASVIGRHGRESVDLIGADPHSAYVGGPLLRRFSAAQLASAHAVALPTPLAQAIGAGPLEAVRIQVGASVVRALLAATLNQSDIGGLVHSPVVLTNVAYAQRLAGLGGRISRIFVRPQRGHEDEVRGELAGLARAAHANLEPADFDATLFAVASAPARLAERLFSAISAIVAFMFALNAMLVTVPARRKLIEDIRLQGATRVMTLQILLFDAVVVGALGCVVGLVLGDALSVAVFGSTPDYLSFAFPVGNERIVTWQSVALALCAGLAAALVGVLWPLRDTLRGSFEHGRRPLVRGRRVAAPLAGLCLLVLTTLLLVLAPQDAVLASATLLLSLLCLLPYLFDRLVTSFEHTQRLLNDASTVLAVVELRTPRTRVRSLAISATVAIALFGVVQFQGAQANLQHGLDDSARDIDSNADVWVTSAGSANTFATTPFALESSTLARVPGVGQIGVYRGSFLNWGRRRLWVLAQPSSAAQPIPPSQLRGGRLALATARVRAGGWAAISQALAAEDHLRIGDAFVLPSPHPVTLHVAALTTNLAWPSGALVMNSQDYARAWNSTDASAYEVKAAAGTTPGVLRTAIARAPGLGTGLVVETTAERERRHFASSREGLSRLTQIRILLLVAAILAVAGAIAAMIWQRRDLVAYIKCDGYSKGVLWRWLCWESALLVGVGSFIGVVFGLYGQLVASHYLASVTGFPVVYSVGLLPALVSLALSSVVAVGVLAVPGYLVARTPARAASPAY